MGARRPIVAGGVSWILAENNGFSDLKLHKLSLKRDKFFHDPGPQLPSLMTAIVGRSTKDFQLNVLLLLA